MQKRYKKFTQKSLIIIIIIFLIPAILNIFIDPYQIFHKHSRGFIKKQRYQNLGLLNSYLDNNKSRNSIIVGTSRTENFIPSKVKETMEWDNVLKLSMSGAQPYEEIILLKYALKTNKVQNVIWGISPAFSRVTKYPEGKKTLNRIQEDLYSHSFRQINYYLFNIDTFKLSINTIRKKVKYKKDLDYLNNWHQRVKEHGSYKNYNSKKNIQKLTKWLVKRRKKLGKYTYTYQNSFKHIDDRIVRIVKENPNVNFYIYFEPVTMFVNSLRLGGGNKRFNRTISIRRYLVSKLKNFPNVELYAFDLAPFVFNLKNWKDGGHHHPKWNQFIIEMIKNKNFKLDTSNISEYEKKFSNYINSYQINLN